MNQILIDRSLVEQALETLTNCTSEYGHRCNRCDSEVDPDGNVASALRAALEQPQVEREPLPEIVERVLRSAGKTRRETHNPRITANDCIKLANWIVANTHPQNLHCKSNQARLATLWGYVKEQPKREPLSNEAIDKIIDSNITTRDVHLRDAFYLCMRDVEVAHGIHETGDEDAQMG